MYIGICLLQTFLPAITNFLRTIADITPYKPVCQALRLTCESHFREYKKGADGTRPAAPGAYFATISWPF
jgi:hypothetical protein